MDEVTKQDEQEEDVVIAAETDEQSTGSNQNKKQDTFTQEQVNRLIAKEKASWKKQNERVSADHETIVEGLRKDITARDEVIQQNVELLKKDLGIDDEDWKDTWADRDVLEQYKYLLKKVEKASKADGQIPRTPQGKKKQVEFQSTFNAGM